MPDYPEPTPEPEPAPEPAPEPTPEPEVEAPEAEGQEPGLQVITTRTKDYLGRALQTIGTNARDSLGRTTKAGDLDYVGRALVA